MLKAAQNWGKASLAPGTYFIVPHVGFIAENKSAPFILSIYSDRPVVTEDISSALRGSAPPHLQQATVRCRASASMRLM